MENTNSSLKKTPVAIIGLSSMFADASNVEEFWNNIVSSKDSIIDVPESRWKIEDYYDPNMTTPDKTYCKRGGFIPDIDFNPMEFGLPPNILEVTDVSQLLALIGARDAFEDAGYGKKSSKFSAATKEKTGVILGVGGGQKLITPLTSRLQAPIWEKALRSSGISDADIPHIVDKMKKAYIGWNENSFPGMLGNVISGRITNRFDLGGINSVVDAACAASLSAIKMAVSELIEGRCDMMLTGGVDTDNSPFMYMSFSKTPAFSRSGNIRPFDDAADGMLIGEGIGMLVLKRLEDAERDGDRIYGLITGVGSSSDGRYKSVYAPRPAGQALAMRRAYEEAGYSPSTVGLIEGHGTGTGAGDPTEFESMQMVFGADNSKKNHIGIGSVKSQIGHTKSAAGAAGMIKAALSLYHKVLPGTINVSKPNHKFNIKDSAFYINAETKPWFRNGTPRRAGVSAFGFGGVNVHFALEEYQTKKVFKDRIHQPFHSIFIKGNTTQELQTNLNEILAAVKSNQANTAYYNLKENSKSLTVLPQEARIGFVEESLNDCIAKLELASKQLATNTKAWTHPKGIYFRPSGIAAQTKVASLFSGQGAQYTGMAKEAVSSFGQLQDIISKFDYQKSCNLANKIYPGSVFTDSEKAEQEQNLRDTEFAQPAIGSVSLGYYNIFKDAGFSADMVAGHSFGEITALCAAGVISEEDYITLAIARGEAMAGKNSTGDSGTMLAVKASSTEILALIANIEDVSIANINSQNQIVLGGTSIAIQQAKVLLDAKNYRSVILPVSAAFHTNCVGHAQKPFEASLRSLAFGIPKIQVYSNSTGTAYPANPASIKDILSQHILNSVDFKSEIENMYAQGARVFVEFGPKSILTNLVKDILADKEIFAISTNPKTTQNSDLQIREAALQLRVLGVKMGEIDQSARPIASSPVQPKMSVKLAGNNYVSPGTKKAYDEVLNNGFKVSGGTEIVKTIEVIKEVEVIKEISAPVTPQTSTNVVDMEALAQVLNSLESVKKSQEQTFEMFQNLLAGQNKQTMDLLSALGQKLNSSYHAELTSVSEIIKPTAIITPAATIEAPVAPIVEDVPAPTPIPATAAVIAPENAPASSEMLDLMLSVVAEKTGYPAEMLELSMDMEADLGIDSIKRVEIFGAITAQSDKLTDINPNDLTELRTLQEIVDYISTKAGISSTAAVQTSAPIAQVVETVSAPTPALANAPASSEMLDLMLSVVAEKTGYPAEMLELSMDMEADLGIDSIKRVEIFGAITAQSDKLTDINPNDLTELRTLQEIVDYISAKAGISSTAVVQAAAPVAQVVETLTDPRPTPVNAPASSEMLDLMLSVVAEKTGYPAEMLELSMDMEADLGIDSIKRVEIFGAITAQSDKLTDINPNDLTELRTLQEIVDYISAKAGISSTAAVQATALVEQVVETLAAPSPTPAPANAPASSEMLDLMLSVVAEKTGYPAEMLELSMDMEADLGIDSIKRVEIFGAITAQSDKLTDINPNDLTELRTLQEIVNYISVKAGISSTAAVQSAAPVVESLAAPIPAKAPANAPASSEMLDLMLSVVAEKTGYPAEMLELSMDMEADLGIDSIKRVEIFGAITAQSDKLTDINPNDLTELRTLQEIVDYISAKAGISSTAVVQATVPMEQVVETVPAPIPTPTPAPANAPASSEMLDLMLSVVAEKTGYPAEMLELSMDMEADLGIDSIKRVEIFGAITAQSDKLTDINPNDLTELRTLQEIVDYISAKAGISSTASVQAAAPVVESLAAPRPTPVNAPASSEMLDLMLSVVAEKTGYPAEMLELSMDMEADLGIDSIKRVEIFGAITAQSDKLTDINPNDLTELRTLQEIVDYISAKAGIVSEKKKSTPKGVEQQVCKEIVQKQDISLPSNFHNVPRKSIGLQYIPRVDIFEENIATLKPIIITDEGSEVTIALKDKLENEGHKVVVVQFDSGKKNSGLSQAITVPKINDESIKTAVDSILAQYGAIGSFIYIHPQFTFSGHQFAEYFKLERELLKGAFLFAKYLQAPLNDASQSQRAAFMTVSQLDGKFGTDKRSNISIIGGGLSGLTKCMNLEWSPVFCRAVDVQPELSAQDIANALFNELHDADVRCVDVAVNEKGRMTYEVEANEVNHNEEFISTLSSEDLFLVSGGGRGVTASCIKEMAKTFKAKFILLGRSSLEFTLPDYALQEDNEAKLKNLIMQEMKTSGDKVSIKALNSTYNKFTAKKEIEATIAEIKSYGGDAVYLQGDVTNLMIKPQLLQIEKQWGKINGVIHGAGRLADKLIQNKKEQDFDNVTSVKLDGLLSLLKMVDINKLKHLIMFSSVAGFYGNTGQSDYAMANEILSTAAHLFSTNHPQTKVSAINWGAWEGGMVSPELQKMFEEAGVSLVNHAGGAARFVHELNGAYKNQAQVIIGGTLPAGISDISGENKTYTIKRCLDLRDNAFLNHHVIQGNPVLPMVNATAWMADSCVKLFPDYKLFSIENVKLFKGIVFDGSEKEEYFTQIKELSKTKEQIQCEVSIYSKGPKLPLNHYRSTVTLVRKRPASPQFTLPTLNGAVIDGAAYYKTGALFHGKYYQGIEEVLLMTEHEMVLKCKANKVDWSEQGQFPTVSLNAFFLDIQYQGMVLWVQKYHEGANSLPLQTAKGVVYGDIPFNESLYVHIKIQEDSATKMIADCTVCTSEGQILLFTEGAGLTVSPNLKW
jgi:acyl transferase domain-containing protein/NAD(P)-dependent dehydrogenase (short-subunit alcohol dehydrogenase family)